MDKQTLIDKLTDADGVDDIVAISKEAGKSLNFEEADKLLGRIMQTKNDAAQLAGDTVEKIATEFFGI
ncbi:hypothetical protein CRD60_03175 [Bifidobacterium aemilianum]|uniref:Nif11 domain-containing protein n=1 Tax=Bifidobacterium aemilianum TaxID=2493120 RepID=A0A366KBY2_9BIFI|nr:hypothetical protein [Bifidobacterium aemilianum]RBP98161.1 hypothetical protein CRD60_03175 [Bifidobacterium aemilianum]